MNNLPHAIVLVGITFVALVGLIKNADNILFWIAVSAAYIVAFATWTKLDTNINNQQKNLTTEKMRLQNRKLELEVEKLKKEVK